MNDARYSIAAAAILLAASLAGCTPMSQSYQVESGDLTCEEANRFAYAAVMDMDMKVTAFTQAKPGRPGRLQAVGRDRRGDIVISCEADGVRIEPRQSGLGEKTFERGVFLSVTGRSGLKMDRGETAGREARPVALAEAATRGTEIPSGSVQVQVLPVRGFETVLDFDADLASAGILPVRMTVRNGSKRAYSFALDGVVVRKRNSEEAALRMPAAEAVAALVARAGSAGAQTPLGNVETASRLMVDQELRAARLGPGESVTGYLYYPVGDYDRVRLDLTDIAAGELEGFLVQF